MGNRVLSIQSNQVVVDENEEIYTDVSLTSGQAEPSRRSAGKYRVSRSINVRAVQNSLDNIFTFIPGERVLDPEFGSKLRYYLYEGITPQNEERIVSEIRSCALKYDPRVQIMEIRNISTIQDTEENTVKLDIVYTIRGLPDRVFSKQFIFNKSQEQQRIPN